jgi:hypothetical protein
MRTYKVEHSEGWTEAMPLATLMAQFDFGTLSVAGLSDELRDLSIDCAHAVRCSDGTGRKWVMTVCRAS